MHGPILGTGEGWTTGEAAGLQTARAVVGFGWPAGTSGSAEPPLAAALPTGAADKTPPCLEEDFFCAELKQQQGKSQRSLSPSRYVGQGTARGQELGWGG